MEGFKTYVWDFQGDRWESIFTVSRVNLCIVTPKIDHLGKSSPVLRVSTHIYGVSKEIDGKMFIFSINLNRMCHPEQSSFKTNPVMRISTHMYGISKEIDGKMFIFRVNLGI